MIGPWDGPPVTMTCQQDELNDTICKMKGWVANERCRACHDVSSWSNDATRSHQSDQPDFVRNPLKILKDLVGKGSRRTNYFRVRATDEAASAWRVEFSFDGCGEHTIEDTDLEVALAMAWIKASGDFMMRQSGELKCDGVIA